MAYEPYAPGLGPEGAVRHGPDPIWGAFHLFLLSQELHISTWCLLLCCSPVLPAGTRDRVVAASVHVLLAPNKGAAAAGAGLQAQLQAVVSKAVEGPYLLSDGSIETTQDALLRCVCESVVKAIRG